MTDRRQVRQRGISPDSARYDHIWWCHRVNKGNWIVCERRERFSCSGDVEYDRIVDSFLTKLQQRNIMNSLSDIRIIRWSSHPTLNIISCCTHLQTIRCSLGACSSMHDGIQERRIHVAIMRQRLDRSVADYICIISLNTECWSNMNLWRSINKLFARRFIRLKI